ncbi:MAG: FAD:protein FMN transferase [Solirubrobacteraceae bacterium]
MSQVGTSVSFPALGGLAVVAVADADAVEAAAEAVRGSVEEIDRACSRFRDDSELSAVNAGAGTAVRVGALLREAVSAALRAAMITDGDVDPTVGQALIALGYDRDFEQLGGEQQPPRPGAPVSVAAVPGWRVVRVDEPTGTIRIPAGVTLDLGSTAKALAADRAAELAHQVAGCGALVSLSGDLAVAGPPPVGGWRVRVTDDHRAEVTAPGQWISLTDGGLATSSTTVRNWRVASGRVHHLIDPASGRPAEVVFRTVTVAAATCLDANIASTATIIRGERAPSWLEACGLPSRLVRLDGRVEHVAGWPRDDDDLLQAGSKAGLEVGSAWA